MDSTNIAQITINNQIVSVEKNENGHFRGLHIVVVDPLNGEVQSANVYDTYAKQNVFEAFIKSNEIKDGSIVVAACKDECTAGLTYNSKQWLANMGS